VLAFAFIASGGKPYYIGGMLPLLFAAGAPPVLAWVRRSRPRRTLGVAALVLSTPAALFTLPIVPLDSVRPLNLTTANYDLGEQIGWPAYVSQIADVYAALPADARAQAQILASNYGEAGAIDRYGHNRLPRAFSGQTGYWYWGPPTTHGPIIAVGFSADHLRELFDHVETKARLDNHHGVDDDEQGEPVSVCSGLRGSWPDLWPSLRNP
jgi:hypothetical protein